MSFIRKSMLAVILQCVLSVSASAQSPVIMEIYGRNGCASDVKVQDEALKVIKSRKDFILINCRMLFAGKYYEEKGEDYNYSRDFCNKRGWEMSKRYGFTDGAALVALVNGRWDANMGDVAPAVNLGGADNIGFITVQRDENTLKISVPEVVHEKNEGEFMLYAYAPSQGIDVNLDNQMLQIQEADEARRTAKEAGVPIVAVDTHLRYLRPVVAMKEIGEWHGEPISLDYSIDNISSDFDRPISDYSFVVVLYEGDSFGHVLAAGELMSQAEANLLLPKSEPVKSEIDVTLNPPSQ